MSIKITSTDSPTLADIQQIVDRWITTTGVRYFSPLTNMAVLAEETGEVARQMARIYGDQSFKAFFCQCSQSQNIALRNGQRGTLFCLSWGLRLLPILSRYLQR